jgi:uncharacterized protein (DUF2147 family)
MTIKNTLVACALMAHALAFAQANPAGLWKTIDDDGKTEKSLVRITEAGGVFSGKIEKVFDPAKQTAVCDQCSDDRKGSPMVGFQVIRNVKAKDGDDTMWDGGDITDPNNGKVYKVRMKPVDGGKKLEVRGYIGAPILGKTQTWLRME